MAKLEASFQRRLEEKSPYLFVEYWKEGARPFNWVAEWEPLSVELSDLQPSIAHEYVARKFSGDEDAVRLQQIDENSIPKDIPADRHKAYRDYLFNLYNDSFTKPNSEYRISISGRFRTEQRRTIGFIRSGESDEGKPKFEEGYISIYGSADIQRGYLLTCDENDAKWNPSTKVGDLSIGLYLNQRQIESTIEQIKQAALANRQIRVTADLYLLAFQSEVERSLSEPYHHQTYWFREGAIAPAILERLTIWPPSSPPAEPTTETPPQPTISVASAPVAKAAPAPRAGYSHKALVIALWAIAIAIVFHALR